MLLNSGFLWVFKKVPIVSGFIENFGISLVLTVELLWNFLYITLATMLRTGYFLALPGGSVGHLVGFSFYRYYFKAKIDKNF